MSQEPPAHAGGFFNVVRFMRQARVEEALRQIAENAGEDAGGRPIGAARIFPMSDKGR